HWYRAQAMAGLGHYAQAQDECEQLGGGGRASAQLREIVGLRIGQAVLDHQPTGFPWPQLPWLAYDQAKFQGRIGSIVRDMRQEANVNVLRGLLLLEEGNVD